MPGPFHEPTYPKLIASNFGPTSQFQVTLSNGGRTVAIGDHVDGALIAVPKLIQPGPDEVDIVIHGLPGRFIEKLGGDFEIPATLVVELLDAAGIPRGTPLRLLTCHAAEAPLHGETSAQLLATEWRGPVSAANGLLVIGFGRMRVDLVEWDPDPVLGGMLPTVTAQGLGTWVISVP